jgi:uncharacterized protein
MDKNELSKKIKSLRPSLEAEGVRHIALFGSRARGTHRPDSDIDILVEVSGEAPFSILNLIGVEHLVRDATGLTANAVMRRSLTPDMKAQASKDAVEIF